MAVSVLVNAPAVVSAVDDAPEAPAPPDALAAPMPAGPEAGSSPCATVRYRNRSVAYIQSQALGMNNPYLAPPYIVHNGKSHVPEYPF